MRNLLALTAALSATPALAAHWTVDATTATLTFTAQQKGDEIKGGFTHFTPEIDFDPAHPEAGKIHVIVDTTSIYATDNKDAQDALPSSDWFDVKKYATAEFTSQKIAAHTPPTPSIPTFDVEGTLSIRGITRPAKLTFTLTPTHGATQRAQGSLTISRHDYAIGQGQWASDAWIAYPVRVQFDLLAQPLAAK